MKQFDIIMLNMSNYSEWDEGVSNRNWHVLKQLEQRPEIGKILAIDYLPLTWKRALRSYKEDIVLNIEGSKIVKRNLTSKVSKVSEKIYVYSDIGFWLRPKHTMKEIKKTALELNFGDFVLWSFFPFVAPYWHDLGQKLTIFDAVDNWSLHSSYEKQKKNLSNSYDTVKDEADVIFVVSPSLLNFFDDQDNVYWVPNGVDIKHYNKKFTLINRDISDLPKPIIGYIGVIQDKVDLDLVKHVARDNKDKSVVLVGPVWNEQSEARNVLEGEENVHFLGYKKYEEAPMYIQQFDVGIIPHKKSGFSASTNPMKMYEYLACGKPVVASDDIGTDNVNEIIKVANTPEDFSKAIGTVLDEDSEEKEVIRRDFVKKFSWSKTVDKMLELVNNKLN